MCNEEDILERQIFIDKVIAVVEKLSKERTSCSFAIEGQWGTGKSFVLDRFKKQISEIQTEEVADNKYMVFHYNCWRYDYYDEPSVAIIAAMLEQIEKEEYLFGQEIYGVFGKGCAYKAQNG